MDKGNGCLVVGIVLYANTCRKNSWWENILPHNRKAARSLELFQSRSEHCAVLLASWQSSSSPESCFFVLEYWWQSHVLPSLTERSAASFLTWACVHRVCKIALERQVSNPGEQVMYIMFAVRCLSFRGLECYGLVQKDHVKNSLLLRGRLVQICVKLSWNLIVWLMNISTFWKE